MGTAMENQLQRGLLSGPQDWYAYWYRHNHLFSWVFVYALQNCSSTKSPGRDAGVGSDNLVKCNLALSW